MTYILSVLPCIRLRGVGPQLAARLSSLGIHTVQDLLFHVPAQYQDRTRLCLINRLRPGNQAVVEGTLVDTQIRYGKRRSLLCALQDQTGTLSLRFFHFTAAQQKKFIPKTRIRCFGEVRFGSTGFEMIHPEYQILASETQQPLEKNLTPIYPSTEGLQQTTWRKITEQALRLLSENKLQDYCPTSLLPSYITWDLATALHYVHRPPPDASVAQLVNGTHPAQQRLAFEELLAHQLSRQRIRLELQQNKAPVLPPSAALVADFIARLPFKLTAAQEQVIAEITQDLNSARPMLRLLQGDVGSGKTVVAAVVALHAIAAGYQVAFMAPTELLAEQHLKNLSHWLEPFAIKTLFLSGGLPASQRASGLKLVARGDAKLVIGTHALFQQSVEFARLGLVIIDEQHRFGVRQRLALWEKGCKNEFVPHQLIMTATPIPRTLAMTAYADLDCSIIDQLPAGRKPISTVIISSQRRGEVIQRIFQACQSGQQGYWVCALIEESEVVQCQAAEATAAFLLQHLPTLRLGLVHGRIKTQEKDQIMSAFKAGTIDLLVATTVIEVGVDVPNATLMVIENAERFGLAQLHQLRGRVGRGERESHCVLMYQLPLSDHAKQRLLVLRNHQDGFLIAQQDLQIRGPGEMLGTRQTGLYKLRIADLLRDGALLVEVQKASDKMLEEFPEYVIPLIKRWVGEAQCYGSV